MLCYINDVKKKVSSYIVQYAVPGTTQSALCFRYTVLFVIATTVLYNYRYFILL